MTSRITDVSLTRHVFNVGIWIALLCLMAVTSLSDPYVLDEAEFVKAAAAIAETGQPLFYYDETRGTMMGLWHPPTYIYYLASWIRTLGRTEIVVRGATLLFTIFTLPLIYVLAAIVRTHVDESHLQSGWREKFWHFPVLCLVLYSTSPLVIQNGTLVDIDGSILAFTTTGFLTWILWAFDQRTPSPVFRYGGTILATATVAWVKFSVFPALLVSVGAYFLLTRRYSSALFSSLSIIAGFVAFTLTWWVIASIHHLPFADPFLHNFGMIIEDQSDRSIPLLRRVLLSGWTLFTEFLWMSPFFITLTGFAVGSRRMRFRRPAKTSDPVLLLLIFSAITVLQYAALGKLPYGFPKYMGTVMPLLVVLVSVAVVKFLPSVNSDKVVWAGVAIGTLVVSAIQYTFSDPFAVPFDNGVSAVLASSFTSLAVFFFATCVVWAGFARLYSNHSDSIDTRRIIIATLLTLSLGTNVGIATTQATADYSTRYFYGERGLESTVTEVTTRYESLPSSQRQNVVVPVDIGYYLDGRFRATRHVSAAELRRQDSPLVVLRSRKYYDVSDSRMRILDESDMYRRETIGTFVIYQRVSTLE